MNKHIDISAVTIKTDPWYCIRLFNAKNTMIMDGKTDDAMGKFNGLKF